MSTITLTYKDKVAHLVINRADKHNALTQSMWQAISDHCDHLVNQIHPRVLIVSGAGGRAFCAGADIHELSEIIQDPVRLKENNQIVQQAQQKLAAMPCVTIAKINGVCVGGGMGLAMACDFRFCDLEATFAITPSKLGLLYSIEDTRRLVNIVGLPIAKELLYLGLKIDASKALECRLISQKHPKDKLDAAVTKLVEKLLDVSGQSISGMKRTLAFVTNSSSLQESEIRLLFDKAFTNEDFRKGAQAFLEKRKADFD